MAYKSIFEEGEIKPATTPKASTGYVSIFNDEEKQLQARSLTKALDDITDRYGLNAVLRADSLIKSSTAKRRHEQIGGHRR